MKIIICFQDTRTNDEDFAITPYIFLVCGAVSKSHFFGLGLCWGYYSICFALGFNLPKNYKTFRVIKYNK